MLRFTAVNFGFVLSERNITLTVISKPYLLLSKLTHFEKSTAKDHIIIYAYLMTCTNIFHRSPVSIRPKSLTNFNNRKSKKS